MSTDQTGRWSKDPNDRPFNVSTEVSVPAGSEATITLEPSDRSGRFFVPVVAISDYETSTYRITVDDMRRYEATVPPVDLSVPVDSFMPPLQFEDDMEITIANLSPPGGVDNDYIIRLIGWQRRRGSGERDQIEFQGGK